jgi:phenylalanyl-tRNA synthetase beta chain
MKISLNWLQHYVSIPIPPAELADRLTMAGLEVEAVTARYAYLDHVLVGKIIGIRPHPESANLRICDVDTGDRTHCVVCGAPNADLNVKAPLALPGTVLPNGTTVKSSNIRGVVSEGMLCSKAELGIGRDHSGIYILDADQAEGVPLSEVLHLSDTIIDIGLTPNRPDCLSVIGIAREVAALLDQPLTPPAVHYPPTNGCITDMTSVTIRNPDLCPRYAAALVTGVAVAPSPFWIQDYLLAIGLKPINNIVDITNYVMMELGQPLHAFDCDCLDEHRIVVRTPAGENEKTFTTLDGKERRLSEETLLICDGKKPVAIAGVMGGENSEITSATTRVLIESACFHPISIRKTAKNLGLNTDASHRFERGVDPEGTLTALERAVQLMVEIAGGAPADGIIDEYPNPAPRLPINLDINQTNRHLGTRFAIDDVVHWLESISFSVTRIDADTIAVIPPSFRMDVSRPEDLMEEVARMWGYDRIETTLPKISADTGRLNRNFETKQQIKDRMTGFGFSEIITYSFIAKTACDRLDIPAGDISRRMLDVLNPLSEDQGVMRTSLIPGLLDMMKTNMSRNVKNLKIFELGKIFISNGQERQPEEIEMLAALWTGSRSASSWTVKPASCDFYDLKGVVEALFGSFKLENIRFSAMPDAACAYTRPGRTAQIHFDEKCIGRIGELTASVIENHDLKQSAFVFELNVDALIPLLPESIIFSPVPRFPAAERDITLIVDKYTPAGDILNDIFTRRETLVENVLLLDVYSGDPIPAGKKSVSLRITYRSPAETLSDQQVLTAHGRISEGLIHKFDALLPA